MSRKQKKRLAWLILFALSFSLFWLLFNKVVPKSNSQLTKKDFLTHKVETFNYVALGDSLTEGVGDATGQGGFVPLVTNYLSTSYGYEVNSKNFGIAGNTSQQILKRMQEQSEIKQALKEADMMTLTVGGNDVMAVIKKNLTNLDVSTFKKASKSYQKRLKTIIEEARKENADLPIYILGIYNPFYLNFPQVTEMQDVINDWNKGMETVTKEYDNVYFVPINDLLYKGVDGDAGIVQQSGDQTTVINDALFSEDMFHPNNTGYQLMSEAVTEAIRETKRKW